MNTTFSLSSHWLTRPGLILHPSHWDLSCYKLVGTDTFSHVMILFHLDNCAGVEWLDPIACLVWISDESSYWPPQWWHYFTFPPTVDYDTFPPPSLQHLLLFISVWSSFQLGGGKASLWVYFHFPNGQWSWVFLVCLLAILIVHVLGHFLTGLFILL